MQMQFQPAPILSYALATKPELPPVLGGADVSPALTVELAARGVAQALVYLSAPPNTLATVGTDDPLADPALMACFVQDPRTLSAALATGQPSLIRSRRRRDITAPSAVRYFPALRVLLGDVNAAGAVELAAQARVRYVAASTPFQLVQPVDSAPSGTPSAATTWGIDVLGVARLWAVGLSGKGIRVGHLDTGVDGNHPALRDAVRDFLLTERSGLPIEDLDAFDTGWHGTHTAATMAGRPVRGRHVGVAPGAELYAAAVIEGGNVVARILAGLNWVAEQDVRLVSLSLGLPGYYDDFRPMIDALRARNILPVVAVGNEGPGTSRSPGNYDTVLSVGNMTVDKQVHFSSSSQYFARQNDPLVPDLVGPGTDVISAAPDNKYVKSTGTSMATPHIAGLAALLWEAKPAASALEIEQAIRASCQLFRMPPDRANLGLPNASRAYQVLTGHALPAATAVSLARQPQREKPRARVVKKVAKRRAKKKGP